MKDLCVADLVRHENQQVTGFFVALAKQVRTKKDNTSYLCVTLSDKTGQVECRLWEAAGVCEFENGDVLKIKGQVCRYQEKLQINLEKLRRATPEEFELADFVPHTSQNIDGMWSELRGCIAGFSNRHLRALMFSFLDDPEIANGLRQAPAAKSLHHAWIGGLLEHIVSLLGLCELAARHYPEINRDLLMTGAVLHDIGKVRELKWGTSFDYTLEGQLVGHIPIGVGMIQRKIAELEDFPEPLAMLVLHMVLSHHGKYEFGSPKLPMIPEAVLFHYLDDLDAKMHTMRSEFARAEAAGRAPDQMTDWVRSMERPLLKTNGVLRD